jgi:hypothetical protein
MLLDKLVYLAIRSVYKLDDDSFTLKSLLSKDAVANSDYSMQVSNVFIPLNEAIQRLSNLDKIPWKVEDVGTVALDVASIKLSKLSNKYDRIVSVYQLLNNRYVETISWKVLGDSILLFGDWDPSLDVYVQYRQQIPNFSDSDLVELADDGTDSNIDLNDVYGISENMCAYIIEYVTGSLLEQDSPSLANLHLSRAEQYFANLDSMNTEVIQSKVEAVHRI